MRLAAVLVGGVLAGAVLVLGAPVAAGAPPDDGSGGSPGAEPGVSISPPSGDVPATVTVTVTCGSDGEDSWTVQVVGGPAETDQLGEHPLPATSGSGSVPVTVPGTAPVGTYEISAYCFPAEGSEFYAGSDDFEVLPPPVPDPAVTADPDQAKAGEPVVLRGDWLPACPSSTWSAEIAGTAQPATVRSLTPIETIAAAPARYTGEFGATVPANAAVGPTEVRLACAGEVLAAAPFRVAQTPPTPGPTAPPPTPPPGPAPPTDPQSTGAPTDRPTIQSITAPTTDPGGSGGGSGSGGGGSGDEASVYRVAAVLPSAGAGLLAVVIGVLVLRAQLTRTGRDWAARHVQVVVREGSVRR